MVCPPFVELSWTRDYFENRGFKYDCLDTNGYGKSHMIDLNNDEETDEFIKEHGQYDVVTDYGTMEHVEDYYMGFKNMDKLCKDGGIMIHVLPAINHWPDHGSWRAPEKLFWKLAKAQKYIVRDIHTEPTAISPGHPSDQVYVVYEKTQDNGFVTREKWESFGPVLQHPIEKYIKGKLGGGRHF